jgi:hypothetical protein
MRRKCGERCAISCGNVPSFGNSKASEHARAMLSLRINKTERNDRLTPSSFQCVRTSRSARGLLELLEHSAAPACRGEGR